MSEQEAQQPAGEINEAAPLPRKPIHPLRRVGCIIVLVIWFAILLLPCFCIVLAAQGEIIISQGRAPNQELRVWLIMEASERGIGISATSTHIGENSSALCVQTNINFILWSGSAEPTVYCDYYTQSSEGQEFSPLDSYSGSCTNE